MKDILVAGDIAVDWIGWEIPADESGVMNTTGIQNWKFWPGLWMSCQEGGVLLLNSFLKDAPWANEKKPNLISHVLKSPERIAPSEIIHSNTILGKFPVEKGEKEKVWRVERYCGFSGPEKFKNYKLKEDPENPDVVVLDDCGNGFRNHPEAWPACIRDGKGSPLVVFKMSRPLAEGELWKKIKERDQDNLILIISANDLRSSGILISHRLSWERTVSDFLWQLNNNDKLKPLVSARHLLVRFGIEGVLYFRNIDGIVSAEFFFTPKFSEDGDKAQFPGDMQGFFDAFVAVLVYHLNDWDNVIPHMGIKEGLAAQWRLYRNGFGPEDKPPKQNYGCIFQPSRGDPKIAQINIPDSVIYFYDPSGNWTILGTVLTKDVESIARDHIMKGKSDELNRVPIGTWGKLVTIDRQEIESFQSIRNLIQEYINNQSARSPLCIAVFGPPGSGKSFGVKQIAASIEAPAIQEMVYNLSQADTPDVLPMMFHKVRDEVLKGKIPLVFFDEFDTPLQNQQFGWLKYFLAPMQDGEFLDGEGMHPVGKAIFIFAGGTCKSYNEFLKQVQKIKDAKGQDFISRLKGYMNIKGCNPSGYNDQFYLIRRAMLFRSMIQRERSYLISTKGEMAINRELVRAFIKVKMYMHGARSMEAIILGSSLIGKRIFNQSALPPRDQLRVHVDEEDFMRHLLGELLKNDSREVLAQKIHEKYLNNSPSMPAGKPWPELPEQYKESNRRQVDDIFRKLWRCGYDVSPARTRPVMPVAFTQEEIEIMAIMEHERWMDEKREKGWTYGDRDDSKKTHPLLVEWDELTESDKNKDRDTVILIPPLLASINFKIVKIPVKESNI
jgi:hypothetical protein